MFKAFLLLVCIVIHASLFSDTLTGKVVKITDGDTVHVLLDNHLKEKIRLAGIDAPELKQPHGKKAKKYLASLIGNEIVSVENDKRDRWGRVVGKIVLNDFDINLAMIKAGYAWHYKKYQKEQYESDRLAYAEAENNARSNKLGLFKIRKTPLRGSDENLEEKRNNTNKFILSIIGRFGSLECVHLLLHVRTIQLAVYCCHEQTNKE